ncbi:neurogenic locus notch homolog protein 2-like [Mya arenaria]|uniref:neurogenic locus notch homolog protein 2-like n=1 Tax=Mya arenaria TaxID=6604 RepID=UPI0022DF1DFC|nr:neurogenic locus notch homolog protein 2-like [Mya arenaria]
MATNTAVKFSFLVVLIFVPSAAGWWQDIFWTEQRPENCPYQDNVTHVCSELREENFTCVTVACCDHFKNGDVESGNDVSEYDDESFSDEDDYHVYYYGRTDSCRVCYSVRSCTLFQCSHCCCDGYTRDFFGGCRKKNAGIECENGGTRHQDWWGHWECSCPHGFMGKTCETPICHCENGGVCGTLDGRPHCNCTAGFEGQRCERAMCTTPCENGGKCVRSGEYQFCDCPVNYAGQHCEVPFKQPATCPHIQQRFDGRMYCDSACAENADCASGELCCREGCSTVCRKPDGKCVMDQKTFDIGEIYKQDSCTTCECIEGGMMPCMALSCAPPKCTGWFVKPGDCCPSCPDERPPPTIRCPVRPVEVNVSCKTDYADLTDVNTDVCAKDAQGNKLPVYYSETKLQHCHCWGGQTTVTASTRDRVSGLVASCKFQVIVTDRHPPKFLSCPNDVFIFEGETPRWQKPSFWDNVGVAHERSNAHRDYYPIGNHPMHYGIVDYDGNRAECFFTISVSSKETPIADLPQGLKEQRGEVVVKTGVIVGAAVGALALLALLAAVVYCCCRKSAPAAASASPPQPLSGKTGYFNNIYALPVDVKLPPYSLNGNPDEMPPQYVSTQDLRVPEVKELPPPSYSNPEYGMLGDLDGRKDRDVAEINVEVDDDVYEKAKDVITNA